LTANELEPGMIMRSMIGKLYLVIDITSSEEDLINAYVVLSQEQKLKTLLIGVNSKVHVL